MIPFIGLCTTSGRSRSQVPALCWERHLRPGYSNPPPPTGGLYCWAKEVVRNLGRPAFCLFGEVFYLRTWWTMWMAWPMWICA